MVEMDYKFIRYSDNSYIAGITRNDWERVMFDLPSNARSITDLEKAVKKDTVSNQAQCIARFLLLELVDLKDVEFNCQAPSGILLKLLELLEKL